MNSTSSTSACGLSPPTYRDDITTQMTRTFWGTQASRDRPAVPLSVCLSTLSHTLSFWQQANQTNEEDKWRAREKKEREDFLCQPLSNQVISETCGEKARESSLMRYSVKALTLRVRQFLSRCVHLRATFSSFFSSNSDDQLLARIPADITPSCSPATILQNRKESGDVPK